MNFILENLEFVWFTVFVTLLTGYALLDGFDLGVGMLHLFSHDDYERRVMLNAIGPLWDGNEVWLVTAGGALFAGFPAIYGTLCSAFYIPVMILLCGLIFRAVAIEFRSKRPMSWWRTTWDLLFCLASLVISLGFGIVVGNLVSGIPLDEKGDFIGEFSTLLHPYTWLTAIFTVTLFMMHGSIFLLMKTEGAFHDKLRRLVNPCIIAFIMCYAIVTLATLIYYPHMAQAIKERPIIFLVALVNMFAIANIPREINVGKDGLAFFSSCLNIICLLALFGIGSYPEIIRASNDPANSLTIWNSASSPYTLKVLLLIAGIGTPLVIAYTILIYTIFHGKVRLDSTSY